MLIKLNSLFVFSLLLFSAFYPANSNALINDSKFISKVFKNYPDNRIVLNAAAPGKNYRYDVGEKDIFYHKNDSLLVFTKVIIEPSKKSEEDKIRLKFTFEDQLGNQIITDKIDVFKLIPTLDCSNEMAIPEMLSEEYNRFGLQFRGWRGEYEINKSKTIPDDFSTAMDRIYRIQLVNNCLEPTKWEFVVDAEDYSDFKARRKSDNYLNQRRILAHSWFNVPLDFYKALFELKNPEHDLYLMDLSYDELSEKSEKTTIDFDQLRNGLGKELKTKILEIGHQSERKIIPLDPEEFYKKQFGLTLGNKEYNYKNILETELPLTRFQDRGFYIENSDPFYVQWLKYVNDVSVTTIKQKDSDSYTEIRIGGEYSPYEIVLGNVDLALMNEQVLCGFLFGVNTYITNMQNNSTPHAMGYDPTQYPNEKKPYLYLVDTETGKWVNNQFKGVEKVYVSYDDLDRDVINIHVLSYERIIPVWMARVKLPNDFVEQLRVRRRMYNY